MDREVDKDHRGGGERRSRALGAAVATLATRQDGVISRAQLRRIGFTEREVDCAVAAKRLHRLYRGVYAVGHRRLSRNGRYLAAVLAGGRSAVLSHRSAAAVWDLRAPREGAIDITVDRDRRNQGDIVIHRNALEAADVTTRHGIPVTTALRTLIDLAACVTQPELERAIRRAEYEHLATPAGLAEVAQARSGSRGAKKMRKALLNLGEAPGMTRSPLEDDFVRFLRRRRLPPATLNVTLPLGSRRVEADCVWRGQKVIVELDGRDAHLSATAFEADRARDSALQARGWRTVRVTRTRLRADGKALAAELRALLS